MKAPLALSAILSSFCTLISAQTVQFIPTVTNIGNLNGTFTLEFDLTPSDDKDIYTMAGFSWDTDPHWVDSFAGYVEIISTLEHPLARLQAGIDNSYNQPEAFVEVKPEQTYHVILDVKVAAKLYTASVKLPDNSVMILAENWGFRQQAPFIQTFVYAPNVYQEWTASAAVSNMMLTEAINWAGWQASSSGDVDTGSFLGWINVAADPWVWSYSLEEYIYLPEDNASAPGGAWIYIPD